MKDEIVEGRLIPHQHEKRNTWNTEIWRMRNLLEHPIDPNWESGRYIKCHIDMRMNQKLVPNTIIFDLVGLAGKGNMRFIRSAFLINKKDNGILYFDSFYFADGNPLPSPKNVIHHNYGVKMTKKQSIKLLERMKKNQYNLYKVGQRPKSIHLEDWKTMKSVAKKYLPKRHVCK